MNRTPKEITINYLQSLEHENNKTFNLLGGNYTIVQMHMYIKNRNALTTVKKMVEESEGE